MAGADVRRPGRHAGDEKAAEDEVHGAWSDVRFLGAEEVMVVCLHECYVFWLVGFWENGGKVDAVDFSTRKCASEIVGDGAGTAAHVEDLGGVGDWGVEDFA